MTYDLERTTDHTEIIPARRSHADRIRDWVELFRDIYKVSEALSRTAFVPNGMQGKTEDIAACIMKGFELGMDPLDSLASMYVVHGRVGVSAEFMRRRILQAGHTFKIVESTDSRAIVEAQRKEGGEPHRATFTAEQARKAGIDIGKYPADKLVARATSRLCRQSFPDVLSGSLLVEDLIDGAVHDAETSAAPAAVKRKQSTRKPLAADTQPKEIAAKPKDETADELLDAESAAPTVTAGATNQQTKEIGELFGKIEVFDKVDRREVIASILGYRLDSPSLMTSDEADTIIETISYWIYGEEEPTWVDNVNDILTKAAIQAADKCSHNTKDHT